MTVNVKNIIRVAEVLEGKRPKPRKNLHFSMSLWADKASQAIPLYGWNGKFAEHTCGTVACIGGWTNIIFRSENDSTAAAAEKLGLDADTAHALFFEYSKGGGSYAIPPKRAAKVLRHLAKTGKVDWTIGGLK